MTGTEFLLASALAFPLVLLLACLSPPALQRMPMLLAIAPMPALAAVLFAAEDGVLIVGPERLHLTFALDLQGAVLLGVAALLWILAGIVALSYQHCRPNRARYDICWLMSLAGGIGVFLAADMIGFYLLLALLTIGACGLVIQHETPRAWRAGGIYIGLGLLAETLLLIAFVLLAVEIPGDSLLIRDAAAVLPASPHRDLILALLISGFGMKAGLVPFHFWMPLAYSAAPMPASAVLSGAAVKASVIGMIRFLPLDAAIPDWGTALAATGLFASLYGVVIGITQRNPKVVLAYSSVSQMGFIVAIIGMGMIAGDRRAALAAAFYAAHHVLVKGALFLGVGSIAATGRRHLWPMFVPACIIAVGIAGLPLTGGGLAKLVADGSLGSGRASTIATVSAIGTTLLMLQFLRGLAGSVAQHPEDQWPAGLAWPWLAAAAMSVIIPWTLYLAVPQGMLPDPLAPALLWKALWPILVGAVLAAAIWRFVPRMPRVPKGDIAIALNAATKIAFACGRTLERADGTLRQWPTAGMALLLAILALGAAVATR
jgi:formate hydrogenlyase subunit 3/multisubunit Na+/H+ antiporter MnhD subunit